MRLSPDPDAWLDAESIRREAERTHQDGPGVIRSRIRDLLAVPWTDYSHKDDRG